MEKYFKYLFKQNLRTWKKKMLFKTMIMFYLFLKWSISPYLLLYIVTLFP